MGTDYSGTEPNHTLLNIVSELAGQTGLGITELAERVGVAKSTVHHHLTTLHDEGYVVTDDSQYRLGLQFFQVGERVREQIPVYQAAKAEIEEMAEETGELALLMVEEQGLGVYLDKAAGESAVDIDAPIGRFATLHNRALGKAILAHFDEGRVEAIVEEHGLAATTDQTIQNRERLFEELEQIRSDGIAINREESIEGLHGIGAPILDADDTVVGAISIAGPSKRLKADRLTEEYTEILSKARNVIELNVQHGNFQ